MIMKRIVKILIVSAIALFAANVSAEAQVLDFLKGAAEKKTENPAVSSGKSAGAAMKALYSQYKKDGRLDMTNMTNMLNLASLANSLKELKGQTSKSEYYKDFAKGLVSGSKNLITSNNSTAIMGGLTDLVETVDLSGLQQMAEGAAKDALKAATQAKGKADTAIDNANEIAESVSNILKLFK